MQSRSLRQLFPFRLRLHSRAISSKVAPLLLSPQQVHSLIHEKKNVSFLDASWFMPNSPRQASQELLSKRIPGAQFLDLDVVASSHELDLKHMMPEERVFAKACEQFGIGNDTHVVIYDTLGIFSSPRALFMFRTFGHQRSSVLDGGLPAWLTGGLPLESGPLSPVVAAEYSTPVLQSEAIKSYEWMVANSSSKAELVLDARSYGRYSGADPEPRPGLPSGHIPNSLSLPFTLFLRQNQSKDGVNYATYLAPEDILRALEKVVGQENARLLIEGSIPVTTTCGSGMTAAIVWLGLKLLGVERIALYDESWTGWAMRPSSTIEKS